LDRTDRPRGVGPALRIGWRSTTNADGSVDVWFGPTAPIGHESNWVQTVPGKGWNVLFRLYGPDEAWFDKTWKPGEIEPVTKPGGAGGLIEELEEKRRSRRPSNESQSFNEYSIHQRTMKYSGPRKLDSETCSEMVLFSGEVMGGKSEEAAQFDVQGEDCVGIVEGGRNGQSVGEPV